MQAARPRTSQLAVPAMMLAKGLCIYLVARVLRSSHANALDRAVLMAQGGEFAFVLFAAAETAGLISGGANDSLTAIVVLSMALTPLAVLLVPRGSRLAQASLDGIDPASGQSGSVLIIGFGRFGQVVSQSLLARDIDVTIIDSDVDMIRSAAGFGFKVYYGDGTRLDVLRASGAGSARAIAVCVDDRDAADRIAALVRSGFPQARLLVRAYDRVHALKLAAAGVDYSVRETFESAVLFGEAALRQLDVDPAEAARVTAEVRRLEAERFQLERSAGIGAGIGMMRTNTSAGPTPTPLTTPRRPAGRRHPRPTRSPRSRPRARSPTTGELRSPRPSPTRPSPSRSPRTRATSRLRTRAASRPRPRRTSRPRPPRWTRRSTRAASTT